VHAKPLAEEFVEGPLRQMTVLMLGAVGFVLLIACANVANLYFARAMGRRRELAVRAALGASRWRLARQQFVEGLVLAAAGAALGVALAAAWNRHLLASIPEELPYWVRIEIDPVVVAYTVGVAVLAAVLFGMLPALRTSAVPPQAALSDGGRTASVGRGARRASGLLVTTQVSLAVVLLVGASLLVRSAMAVARADVGTDDAHLLTARTLLDGARYRDVARRVDHFARAVDALGALPGVRAASATTALPTDDGGEGVAIVAEGRSTAPGDEIMGIAVGSLPGLFDALGAPLVAGRDFTAREAGRHARRRGDRQPRPRRAALADAPALGRRVRVQVSGGEATWVTVVGVAPDLMYGEFGEQESTQRLQVHLPYARLGWRAMSLVVRATGEPVALAAPARRAIAALDPLVPVFDVLTMREVRRVTTYPYRPVGRGVRHVRRARRDARRARRLRRHGHHRGAAPPRDRRAPRPRAPRRAGAARPGAPGRAPRPARRRRRRRRGARDGPAARRDALRREHHRRHHLPPRPARPRRRRHAGELAAGAPRRARGPRDRPARRVTRALAVPLPSPSHDAG
jgi:predicted permease